MSDECYHPTKILVFLPHAAASVIVAKLAQGGYASVAVSTVPEVFDALRSGGYSFAITTRPEINLLRNIRSIPVVNLEIYFHAVSSNDGTLVTSKQFDGRAFLDRIEFLSRPGISRARSGRTDRVPSVGVQEQKVSHWRLATNKITRFFHAQFSE